MPTDEGHEDFLSLALSLPIPAARHACARALMRVCPPKPVHLTWAASSGDSHMLTSTFDWLVANLGPASTWINATPAQGQRPLMAAVFSQSLDSVALLLSWGADASLADSFGSTPLILASKSGLLDLIKLLAPVSPLDAVDQHGVTALMRASDGHPDCARFLLPLCDPRPRDHSGRDALEQACWERPSDSYVVLGLCEALRMRVPSFEWTVRVARASGIADACGNRRISSDLQALVSTELERVQLDAITAFAVPSPPNRI